MSAISHGQTSAQRLDAQVVRERRAVRDRARRLAVRAAEDAAAMREVVAPVAAAITEQLRRQLQQEGEQVTDEERAAAQAAQREDAVGRSLSAMRAHLGLNRPPLDDGATVSAAGLAADRVDGDPAVAAALERMRGRA